MRAEVDPSVLVRLLERLQEKESLELEFKAATGGLPKSLWPTVSAFANTQGGWLVLGVDETAEPSLTGVPNPDRMLQNLHDLMRSTQKISYPVCGQADATIESLGAKSLIVIRVPAAPRRARPVYINGNPYQGTYVRRHGGDYRCSKAEVDRMMREALDSGSDSTILAHFSIEDLEIAALRRYRQRFQTRDPGAPSNGYDDRRFLLAIGAYRRDREAGVEGVTIAGLILLGRTESISEWRRRHLIDFRIEPTDLPEVRWLDRVAWNGGLFQAFETIYPKLVEGLPAPFRLEGGFRVDQGPHQEALREALVNLLVHADYAESDASLIKRMPEGYLFRNPGNSRVLESDLLTGDRSDPRNPVLVRMFRLVGLADEAGTGLPKIIRAWRSLGFQLPRIEVGTERYEFALTLRHAHFLPEDDRSWLQSLGANWSEAEQLALIIARHEGEVDNLSVRRLTGQHMADVTRVLGGLRDRGLLQMLGVKRGARYQLGQLALAGNEESSDPDAIPHPELPRVPEASPANLDASPANLDASPANLDASPANSAASRELDAEGLAADWTELMELARPVRERTYMRAEIRDTIVVRLCEVRSLSAQELATLLDRSSVLVRAALRRLIIAGRLMPLYPEQPSHPRQRYTAQLPSTNITSSSPDQES